MDKGLRGFYVYGYWKIIVNVSKNINTLLTCVSNAFHVWLFFHTWQIDVAYEKIDIYLTFLVFFNYNQVLIGIIIFIY
jgi:hypothetical protein